MIRRRDNEADLRARITDALTRDVGVSERMAQPFVDSILRCFAGQQPYFPSGQRDYPVLQIRAALQSGTAVKKVMRDFDVSRTTLHKLFPGGLPRSAGSDTQQNTSKSR